MYKLLIFVMVLIFTSCGVLQKKAKVECPESVVDYDKNSYKVVRIGNQCWMADNLKSTHYSDGSEIEETYAYNDDESNVENYGRLYSWSAAMKGADESDKVPSGVQGACPEGWHLPSDAEWGVLEKRLGVPTPHLKRQGWDASEVGGRLKSRELWEAPNDGATNDRKFSAVPSGSKNAAGAFTGLKTHSFYWSSSMLFSLTTWGRGLSSTNAGIYRFNDDPSSAFSIRCVKD